MSMMLQGIRTEGNEKQFEVENEQIDLKEVFGFRTKHM
jgi:hypothetical protein